VPRRPAHPTSMMPQAEDVLFCQLCFQSPGIAEVELERDVHGLVTRSAGHPSQLSLTSGAEQSGLDCPFEINNHVNLLRNRSVDMTMDRKNETVRLSGQLDVELRIIIDQQVLKLQQKLLIHHPGKVRQ